MPLKRLIQAKTNKQKGTHNRRFSAQNQHGNGKLHAQFPSPINQSTRGPRGAITTGAISGYYCISAPLGKDAVGEVWLARDRRLNREVTIKVREPSASQRRLSVSLRRI